MLYNKYKRTTKNVWMRKDIRACVKLQANAVTLSFRIGLQANSQKVAVVVKSKSKP